MDYSNNFLITMLISWSLLIVISGLISWNMYKIFKREKSNDK